MADRYFHVFPSQVVYFALSNTGDGCWGRRLTGLGGYILSQLPPAAEVEFSLSASLVGNYETCGVCVGVGRVDDPTGVAPQFVGSVFGEIDWSMKPVRTCEGCRGMGVILPGFFDFPSGSDRT